MRNETFSFDCRRSRALNRAVAIISSRDICEKIMLFRPSRATALLGVLVVAISHAWADDGQIVRNVTLGTSDSQVAVKAGTKVKVLSANGGKDVISVDLPDGSSGIYQVDAALVQVAAPAAAPATTAPAVAPPPPATPAQPPAPPTKSTANTPAAPVGPPTYDSALIGGPEFDTTAGKQAAGTACLAKLKDSDQCYILTARHLLGPDGGFDKETTLDQVPDFVKGIRFQSFDGTDHYYSTKGLLIQNDPADTTDLWNDLCVFPVSNGPDRPLLIADKSPSVGDPVWVVAHVLGGVPDGEVMHRAVVSYADDRFVNATFDNDQIQTAGASGAPVLNAAGEVIGVYSGHYAVDGGHVGANIISARRVITDIKAAPSP